MHGEGELELIQTLVFSILEQNLWVCVAILCSAPSAENGCSESVPELRILKGIVPYSHVHFIAVCVCVCA